MRVIIRDINGDIVMTLHDPNSDGNLVVETVTGPMDNVDADGDGTSGTETFTVGQFVGTYNGSRINFFQDVNPGDNPYSGQDNIALEYISEDAERSYVQLGHGGYDADNTDTALGNTGEISVTAGGSVSFIGGASSNTFAQLGHGGYATNGNHSGDITVDAGAARALENGKSLLPAGVTQVSGDFGRGDPVAILSAEGAPLGQGLSRYTSEEAAIILGRQSTDIETLLGYPGRAALIHRDDMAL